LDVGICEGERNKVSYSKLRGRNIYSARTCNQPHLPRYPHLDPPLDGTEAHRSRSQLKSFIAKSVVWRKVGWELPCWGVVEL